MRYAHSLRGYAAQRMRKGERDFLEIEESSCQGKQGRDHNDDR
jgi:hypothetical protein